jgi:DNA mismatch endonuclease (patch repair protein)
MKFTRNQERARLVNRTLRRKGWCVLRIWEHELSHKNENRLLRRIQQALV